MGTIGSYLAIFILFVSLSFTYSGIAENANIRRIKRREIVIEDVSDLSVFYSLKNNETIKNMMPRPWILPGQPLRLPFIGEPCSCYQLQCGCCSGIRISQFNFDRRACANITYDPFLFALVLDVSLNNVSVLHNSISAKNPPPICIPIPLAAGIVGIDLCIKLFEIYTPGVQNIHVCMDWEIRIAMAPILILHFDCLKIGANGLVLVKPDNSTTPSTQGSPLGGILQGIMPPSPNSGDIYDEVTEMILDETMAKNLTTSQKTSNNSPKEKITDNNI